MQFNVSGSILFLPPYTREEKKTFGLSWKQTQVLLLHKQPLWPLDHGSSGICYSVVPFTTLQSQLTILEDQALTDVSYVVKFNGILILRSRHRFSSPDIKAPKIICLQHLCQSWCHLTQTNQKLFRGKWDFCKTLLLINLAVSWKQKLFLSTVEMQNRLSCHLHFPSIFCCWSETPSSKVCGMNESLT